MDYNELLQTQIQEIDKWQQCKNNDIDNAVAKRILHCVCVAPSDYIISDAKLQHHIVAISNADFNELPRPLGQSDGES